MKTQKDIVIEKLNSKRFRKNNLYSTKQISSILGTTNSVILHNGSLNFALRNSPEWKHEYRRMWTYLGPQINNPMPSKSHKKQVIKTQPKRREISLFWGLISIR